MRLMSGWIEWVTTHHWTVCVEAHYRLTPTTHSKYNKSQYVVEFLSALKSHDEVFRWFFSYADSDDR